MSRTATFQNNALPEVDLGALSAELEELRQAVAQRAEGAEQQEQLGLVASATIAAMKGDRDKVASTLANMSKWTLSVAEKLGVGVATKLITQILDRTRA
ncbi:hypothetical protein QTI24_29435 [Variovorax sp. J22P240]|uniref:hypothetical protein n=1 Tax=Variovorax sp. J22P240 TaxID=3053514 RepID=UPI002574EDAE|nr:hypothetical protein [Variovorax sp. J22P240]MDM0002752.1 hypothetical protein [Variovorax sp. J22P240]